MQYFAIKDIFGDYKNFLKTLRINGFKKYNSDHILVVWGNVFGPGSGNVQIYKYLISLPKNRKFLILGDNEQSLINVFDMGLDDKTELIIDQFINYQYPGINLEVINKLFFFSNIGIVQWLLNDWKKINKKFEKERELTLAVKE